jgi:N-acetylmuramoyl-L-alanine amidase
MATVHTVRQGECLSSIARQYGFKDWQVLYDDPANAELKKRRPNPNLLYPGDLVAIPEPKPMTAQKPTGDWHDITLEREQARLKVQLMGLDGKALAGQDYELTVDGETRSGTTDGSGLVDEPVDIGVKTAELKVTVPAGDETRELTWQLNIGALDPVTTIGGMQARLAHLQYYTGAIDGNYGPMTRGAVMSFQANAGLDVTGVPDQATLDELQKQHDEVT